MAVQKIADEGLAVRQNPQVFRSPACSYEVQRCPRVARGEGRLRRDLLPCPIRDRTDCRAGNALPSVARSLPCASNSYTPNVRGVAHVALGVVKTILVALAISAGMIGVPILAWTLALTQ
jgi:hypothetical protein